jgi:hypothetical protein
MAREKVYGASCSEASLSQSAVLGQICDCKEESLFAYNMGLPKTGI